MAYWGKQIWVKDEKRGTATKFLPKRSYQNVPTETFLKIKFLQIRLRAIKFLNKKVPEIMLLRIRLLNKFGSQKKHSQVQMVPMHK
jgi:hypothetical protein